MLSIQMLKWPTRPPLLVKWEENGPGPQTFWINTGVVFGCCVSVAYADLNTAVPRCVNVALLLSQGLAYQTNPRLHECTSRM
jgi:hypothetical protein